MNDFWHACLNWMTGSGGALMMFGMTLFWLGVLVVIVLGIRWLLRQRDGAHNGEAADPLRILERRFAAGEIDREEFEQRRRALLGS